MNTTSDRSILNCNTLVCYGERWCARSFESQTIDEYSVYHCRRMTRQYSSIFTSDSRSVMFTPYPPRRRRHQLLLLVAWFERRQSCGHRSSSLDDVRGIRLLQSGIDGGTWSSKSSCASLSSITRLHLIDSCDARQGTATPVRVHLQAIIRVVLTHAQGRSK